MKQCKSIRKSTQLLAIGFSLLTAPFLSAQTPNSYEDFDKKYKDYNIVYQDTTESVAPTVNQVVKETHEPYSVVTNKFGKNWFVFATAGIHSFRGDYSSMGKFNGTLTPDFGVGVGKWFTPGIGIKFEFIRSNSEGYTGYTTGHYGYGPIMQKPDGTPYRKMRTRWWDISGSVVFNLSRLFLGYDGYVARGIFYQTNFDLEYGQADKAANKWDSNLGIDLGFTFYLGKSRSRAWKMGATHTYTRDYRERQIREVRAKETVITASVPSKYTEVTFYVFYPNNYSGRNDAPNVPGENVNAIDYLTNGIYTQKRFVDRGDVASHILNGKTLKGLKTENIPTEAANQDIAIDFIPRGYEMGEGPISLSMNAKDMADFREKAGYYYSPIYGDHHLCHTGKVAYGLNAHNGLETIRKYFDIDRSEYLVSLADMYAALTSNDGHIALHTDPETVEIIQDIINNGAITSIQVEGLATSQDNYSGPDAKRIGFERNQALSQNRANTVLNWLKNSGYFNNVDSKIYRVNAFKNAQNGIGQVNDPSTRGLNAKMNRCVKVHIQYLMPSK